MKKISKLLFGILAVAMLLASCGGGSSAGGGGSANGGGSSEGGGDTPTTPAAAVVSEITIASENDVATFDTNVATDGTSFEALGQFTSGLMANGANGLEHDLATDYSISDDGLVYTFNIRQDSVWVDKNGEVKGNVTASDFEFSWKRLVDPATGSVYSYMGAPIKNGQAVIDGELPPSEYGVKATGDYTLEVTLENPLPYFIQLAAFPLFYPISPEIVEASGASYGSGADYVWNNGAYRLTSYINGNGWTLEKNESYFDSSEVSIGKVNVRVMPDYNTSALEFETSSLDVTKISAELINKYINNADQNLKDSVSGFKLGYVWYLSFNLNGNRAPELQNANLRRAIASALDRDYIADTIMKDGSVAAPYIVPRGLADDQNGVDFREGPNARLYYEYNESEAKRYVELAKSELGIESLSLELLIEDTAESGNNAIQIQNDLAAVGITVNIVTVPKPDRLARMRPSGGFDYEISLTRWGPDYKDPYTYLGDCFSPISNPMTVIWGNDEYAESIAKVSPGGELSTDFAARWLEFHNAERILLGGAFIAPIWQSGETYLVNPKLKGYIRGVGFFPRYRYLTLED